MSFSLSRIAEMLRAPEPRPGVVWARSGLAVGAGLLVSVAMLSLSHALALGNLVAIAFAILLMLPALVAAWSPAVGLAVVLAASLISAVVPVLIPQLTALGAESTFAIALLTAGVGLLLRSFYRRERLTGTPVLVPLLACGAWVLLSFAWNAWRDPAQRDLLISGFKGFATIALFFLYAANAVRTQKALRGVLLTLVFLSIPVSAVGYLQYARLYLGANYSAIHPGLEQLAENVTFKVRIASTLSETTILSLFYLVILILAVALLFQERSRWLKAALALTIALDLWPFLLSFSKSTLIVALCAVLLLAWMRRSWVMAAGAALIGVLSVKAISLVPVLADMGTHAISYGLNQQDGDITQRVTFMKECLASVPHHPVFGVGPLGSEIVTGVNCHSVPIELLTDFGVIGLALFGWLIWRVFGLSWRVPATPANTLQGTLAQTNRVLLLAFAVLALLWSLVNFTLPWLWCIVAVMVAGQVFPARPAGADPAVLAVPSLGDKVALPGAREGESLPEDQVKRLVLKQGAEP